nr:MAG TPA: hypothetical protein [Caudoviricetes sp.]
MLYSLYTGIEYIIYSIKSIVYKVFWLYPPISYIYQV